MKRQEPASVRLDYASPQPREGRMRRVLPYVVFVVCALLAGLFWAWLRDARTEYTLFAVLAVFFALGAVVLPFLIQRDNCR